MQTVLRKEAEGRRKLHKPECPEKYLCDGERDRHCLRVCIEKMACAREQKAERSGRHEREQQKQRAFSEFCEDYAFPRDTRADCNLHRTALKVVRIDRDKEQRPDDQREKIERELGRPT